MVERLGGWAVGDEKREAARSVAVEVVVGRG